MGDHEIEIIENFEIGYRFTSYTWKCCRSETQKRRV